jgi:hypothetical protein
VPAQNIYQHWKSIQITSGQKTTDSRSDVRFARRPIVGASKLQDMKWSIVVAILHLRNENGSARIDSDRNGHQQK